MIGIGVTLCLVLRVRCWRHVAQLTRITSVRCKTAASWLPTPCPAECSAWRGQPH